MSTRVGLAVVLTLFAGLYWFHGTAYSQDDYYTCYTPDGTYFESATPCDNSYDYDYDYPYYDYYTTRISDWDLVSAAATGTATADRDFGGGGHEGGARRFS